MNDVVEREEKMEIHDIFGNLSVLTTERLRLRKLVPEDVERIPKGVKKK